MLYQVRSKLYDFFHGYFESGSSNGTLRDVSGQFFSFFCDLNGMNSNSIFACSAIIEEIFLFLVVEVLLACLLILLIYYTSHSSLFLPTFFAIIVSLIVQLWENKYVWLSWVLYA